jgi:hypothetical protein
VEEVKGGNRFPQRAMRPIFRAPHYRSGDELAHAITQEKATTKAAR